jgi:2-dehydro-3-deoxyphosphogluconate aldolase/(4S)-4-hydroxy-2-oxoglutarate aldolase
MKCAPQATTMTRAETINRVMEVGIVPVVRASSGEAALGAAAAIKAGGIPIIEITMTVPGALRVIEEVAARYGSDVLIGAGTVLDAETARACMLAGAEFIVSPALNVETIAICRRYGKVVMPGALTPTEILTAWQAGADFVKVFPCDSLGGAKYIKSLKAPLPQIQLVPTGGVTLQTAADFIKAGSSALGVGTDLVDMKALADGQDSLITERARQFVEILRESRRRD